MIRCHSVPSCAVMMSGSCSQRQRTASDSSVVQVLRSPRRDYVAAVKSRVRRRRPCQRLWRRGLPILRHHQRAWWSKSRRHPTSIGKRSILWQHRRALRRLQQRSSRFGRCASA